MNKVKETQKCNVKINLIVGIDKNNAIGYDNKVLFDCVEDEMFYKSHIENSIVIMGRGSFEAYHYKVLPNRLNIVVSSSLSAKDFPQYGEKELMIFSDFESVIVYLNKTLPKQSIFIIGGASVYKWFLENDYIDFMYINVFDKAAQHADRFFPIELCTNKFHEVFCKEHHWLVDKANTIVYEKHFAKN